MTDITKIFTLPPSRPQYNPTNNVSASFRGSLGRYTPPNLHTPVRPLGSSSHPQIDVSHNAKQVLSRAEHPNMHGEVAWFKHKYMMEGLIKIVAAILLSLGLAYCCLSSFSIAASLIAVCSLSLALRHNIFSYSSSIQAWAFASLVFSSVVLTNEVFLEVIYRFHRESAVRLSQHANGFVLTLLPSLHISLMLGILTLNSPLLNPTPHRSFLENLLSTPSNLWYSLSKIYKMKYMLSQCYVLIVLGTFLLANCCVSSTAVGVYSSGQPGQSEYGFFNIIDIALNPVVFFCEWIAFAAIYIFFNIVFNGLSSAISELLIKLNYDDKNQFTRIPFMLELLRADPSEEVTSSAARSVTVSVANVFSFYSERRPTKLSKDAYNSIMQRRGKVEAMYSHCLSWVLTGLLAYNPNALQTKIGTSKFYHRFADIMDEFACKELQRCVMKLYELQLALRNYEAERAKNKPLIEDMLHPLRILAKQVRLWLAAIECVRYLGMVDYVLQILICSRQGNQNASPNIIRSLKELRDSGSELKDSLLLNEAIREKMGEYYSKCSGTFNILSDAP